MGSHTSVLKHSNTTHWGGAVGELVEHRTLVWHRGSLVHCRVKPTTYQIYTYRFLAWCSALTE